MLKNTINFSSYIYDTNYINGGKQIIFRFKNGYGASLVNHSFSYGNELAVIIFNNPNEWTITYNTPITNDVLTYLSNDEIFETLEKIKNL